MGQLLFLASSSGSAKSIRRVVGDATLLVSDDVLLIDASGGVAMVMLMPIALSGSKSFFIKKDDAVNGNFVQLVPSVGETVENSPTIEMPAAGDAVEIVGYQTNWRII